MNKLNSAEISIEQLIKTIADQNLMLLRAQDREIGLIQELNTIKAGNDRQELLIELAIIKSSTSYKISRGLSSPFRLIGYLLRQFGKFAWKAARKVKRLLTK